MPDGSNTDLQKSAWRAVSRNMEMEFSFQMYGARNFPPILEILPKLKALGYAQVEGYGGLYGNEPGLAQALRNAGLTMPTGHFGLDTLEQTEQTIELARKLGTEIILCPAPPEGQREMDEAGWKALAATLAGLCEIYNKAGFQFGWHNHHWEFQPTASGRLPIEILLDEAPGLVWECDVAWVVKGKADPIAWIRRYKDRLVAIHVKDIAPEGECVDEDGWADVGHGVMDWQGIMNVVTAETDCRYFVMEHDNPNDVERFARRSIESARKLGN